MVTGAFPIAAPLASVTVPIMFPETAWPMTLGWNITKIPKMTTRRGNNAFIGALIAGHEPGVIEHRNSNESIKLLDGRELSFLTRVMVKMIFSNPYDCF